MEKQYVRRPVQDTELYHYGVKGMKWGVRKSAYNSLNRQQRKEVRKKYYNTPEGKIKKATTIGTFLVGPLGGVIAGSITSKRIGDISKSSIDKGKREVEKHKNVKIKTISQKTYDKFHADDIEGIVQNMSKEQYDDVKKHVGNRMDNGDWAEVADYIARKYN